MLISLLVAGAATGVALSRLALWGFHLKRFAVVDAGVLYRCAQPTEWGLAVLASRYGVRTIASLRRENPALRRDLLDLDQPSGSPEDEAAARLGARPLRWPMGGEAYWPWFGPEQLEAFFELMDEPENYPVAVHCIGGRHRTGTFVALYRLEYDRWSVEDALREMYSFDFGPAVPVLEHNLRTYFPRPLPTAAEWAALRTALGDLLDHPADYPTLIRRLRQSRWRPEIRQALEDYVSDGRPFWLCLAHRVIDQPGDALAAIACRQASACWRKPPTDVDALPAVTRDWAIAAALVADFGSSAQQQELLRLLAEEPRSAPPSRQYQALVRGVTNRYSLNRIAFLRPILDDPRNRVEPAATYELASGVRPYRYCDTAVARLCTITNQHRVLNRRRWDEGRKQFASWFAAHPEVCRTCRLGEQSFSLSRGQAPTEDRDDYR